MNESYAEKISRLISQHQNGYTEDRGEKFQMESLFPICNLCIPPIALSAYCVSTSLITNIIIGCFLYSPLFDFKSTRVVEEVCIFVSLIFFQHTPNLPKDSNVDACNTPEHFANNQIDRPCQAHFKSFQIHSKQQLQPRSFNGTVLISFIARYLCWWNRHTVHLVEQYGL